MHFNSQLLKSSSSSYATLTASFSFSSSKHSLHLGRSRSSTICGCDTWIQFQPKAIPSKTSSFLKSIQLLLNSRTVWDSLPCWIMCDIQLELKMSLQQLESKYLIQVSHQSPLIGIYSTSKYLLQRFDDNMTDFHKEKVFKKKLNLCHRIWS